MIATLLMAVSIVVIELASGVAPASAEAVPGLSLSVDHGTASTPFAITLTAPDNRCQGDTTGGYRWNAFLASSRVDLDSLSVQSGLVRAANETYPHIDSLYSTTTTPQTNRSTAIGTGQIVGLVNLDFSTNQVFENGVYQIGIFCSLGGTQTRRWSTSITVTEWVSATDFRWTLGVLPEAPVGTTAVGADGQISVVIAPVVATPAVTSYTVEVSWSGGNPDPSPPRIVTSATAGPFTVTGLVLGAIYLVEVWATSSIGSSPRFFVGGVVAATTLSVPAPSVVIRYGHDPVVPTALRVEVTAPVLPPGAVLREWAFEFTGSTSTLWMPPPLQTLNGSRLLEPCRSYPWTLWSSYQPPYIGETASGVFVTPCTHPVVQDITVGRPQGGLVLTQRCGVYGSAAAYSDEVFGQLPPLPATPGADPDRDNGTPADPTDDFYDTLPGGTAPKNDSAPFDPTAGIGTDDSLFPQYPYPVDASGDSVATYPTNCSITLDTPRLITSGPKAGQYFRTTGRLAQLTVVNTQNVDGGWTLNGTMGDFSNGTDSFSGNLMGWDPEVTWHSRPNLDHYSMRALPGLSRQPQPSSSSTGLGAAANATNTTRSSSLAQAVGPDAVSPNSGSLGMAVVDARLRLLIPVGADEGTYRAALTFTVI